MSTLRVATIETEDEFTDLTFRTGNTSGPQITIYSGNGEIEFTTNSNITFGGANAVYTANVNYSGSVVYTGNADFSSANVIGVSGGGGLFKGENGTTGPSAGDIFRINNQTLNSNVTISNTENASLTGPLEISNNVTLTVEGYLSFI